MPVQSVLEEMSVFAFLNFFQTVIDAVEFVNSQSGCDKSCCLQGDFHDKMYAMMAVCILEFHSSFSY